MSDIDRHHATARAQAHTFDQNERRIKAVDALRDLARNAEAAYNRESGTQDALDDMRRRAEAAERRLAELEQSYEGVVDHFGARIAELETALREESLRLSAAAVLKPGQLATAWRTALHDGAERLRALAGSVNTPTDREEFPEGFVWSDEEQRPVYRPSSGEPAMSAPNPIDVLERVVREHRGRTDGRDAVAAVRQLEQAARDVVEEWEEPTDGGTETEFHDRVMRLHAALALFPEKPA